MKIIPITSVSQISESLTELAEEWLAAGEFWSIESCESTMRTCPKFLSAAAFENSSWDGWYLATVQDSGCELLFIYCRKAKRGRGIARALLKDLIERVATIDGAHSIFLEVRASNVAATHLYESLGFTKVITRPRYYKNGEDALVYRLQTQKN